MRGIVAHAVLVLVLTSAAFAADVPITVSPDHSSKLALVEGRCPTFSWGTVPGTDGHELVVYRVGEDGDDSRKAKPVLRETFAGSASSWTPSLGRCLERGGQYAWSVRAIRGKEASEWSVPSLFQVASGPSETEFEEAVMIVQQYVSDVGLEVSPNNRGFASTEGQTPAAAAESGPAANALGGADFSIDGSGNVEGLSFGGDGSALTNLDWGNIGNLPPGFADGTDNEGVAYAAGNQLTLDATTFNVVEGSGSNLDADLLDGLEALAFALGSETYSMAEVDALLTVDNIDGPIPAAPTLLRVGPEYRFPGMRRLSWNIDSLAGVASFVVYQANFPITDGNKATAQRMVTPSLYAAVDLFPGSGTQHFRVEAQNVLGEAGPLSAELAIDTTSRLAYIADQRFDGVDELFVVPSTGGGSTVLSEDPPTIIQTVRDFQWSPNGSRIAYRADQDTDGVFELYVVAATGGDNAKVSGTLPPGGDVGGLFRWSPDGSRIAYRADGETNDVFELYVVAATGGSPTKVNDTPATNGDVSFNFYWSPDGSRIAYIAGQDNGHIDELYVVPATGGGNTRVSGTLPPGREVQYFSWSPDGSRIAYSADRDTVGVNELYVVAATGGGATRVNDPLASGDVSIFSWSPDGSRLIYRANPQPGFGHELYVVPATAGGAIKVNDSLVADGSVGNISWSPDGTRIAYTADQDIDAVTELYVVPATGGGTTKVNDPLVSEGTVRFFSWSPDSSRIAYTADQDTDAVTELYVVPATGGGTTKVNDPFVTGGDVNGDINGGLGGFSWSPDGSRIAYIADGNTDGVLELYVAPATGGDALKVNDSFVSGGSIQYSASNNAWSPLGGE